MEEINKQPRNIKMGNRAESGFCGKAGTTQASPPDCYVNGRKQFSETRSGSHVGKRYYTESSVSKRSVSEQHFPSSQETRGKQASEKKHLNGHFKMEGLHLLRDLLKVGDYMCKIDLKDAYFCVPIHTSQRKYIRFQWEGQLYEFLCLCFGLGPAPRIFTKLLKIPIAVLRRINIRLIIYLDDILLMAQSLLEMNMARDTLMFLFQHLGMVINLKKSVLTPTQIMEFLGLVVDSVAMTLALPVDKVTKLKGRCQKLIQCPQATFGEMASLIVYLCSTVHAVLPASLQRDFYSNNTFRCQRTVRTLNFPTA